MGSQNESAGASLTPLLASRIAVRSSLRDAILIICVSTWLLCAIILSRVAYVGPRDMLLLRTQMRQRADRERATSAE